MLEELLAGAALGNAVWLLVEKILRLAVSVFVSAWMARYMGPEQFGALNYALALVALFGIVANAGLDTVVVRDIARHPEHRDALLGSAFTIKLAGGVVAVGCALGVTALLGEHGGPLVWLVLPAALALLFQAFDTVDLWFQSQLKARSAVVARNTAFLAVATVKVVLVLMKAPLQAFAWAVFLEAVLAALALAAAYRLQRGRFSAWRREAARIAGLLREGWPLVLAGFMVAVYMRIDQVMLGSMAGVQAVGLYSAAVSLSEPLYFAPVAIVMSAAPALARYRQREPALFERHLILLFRLLLLISALMAIVVSLGASTLVHLVFGAAFEGAGAVVAVHAWSVLFVALGVASSQYLVVEGLTRISFQRTLVGAALNITLNVLWIPEYGALGCAWATLLSYAAATFFLFHTSETRRCLALMLRALWVHPGTASGQQR